MALAICLLFDTRTDRAVRRVWDRLEDLGIPTLRSHTHGNHVPHLSYAVLRTWRLDEVRGALETLPDGGHVDLWFDGIGSFRRGRTWLLSAVTGDVVVRQERVIDALLGTGADLHQNYRPGAWIPHCTVAPRVRLDAMPAVAATIYDVLPLRARADRAALIDSGTGEQWILPHIP